MSGRSEDQAVTPGGMIVSPGSSQPKGLFHALAEIEQWSVTEMKSGDIDPQVVTTPVFLSFVSVGWHTSAVTFLASFLSMPFSYGVFKRIFPIFGTSTPSAFDVFFAFFISLSPVLMKSLFVAALLGRCHMGATTRKAVNALVWWGIVFAKWTFCILGFLLYHLAYYKLFTPSIMYRISLYVADIFSIAADSFYAWIFAFRQTLIASAWILLLAAFLQTLIFMVSYFHSLHRTRITRMWREKWVPVSDIVSG